MGSNATNIESFIAGDTISAKYIVGMNGTTGNTVFLPNTYTVAPIGVTYDYADSGSSIPVQVSGIAKIIFNATCTTGGLVTFATGTGLAIPYSPLTGTASWYLGILVGPSVAATGTVGEVLIKPAYVAV